MIRIFAIVCVLALVACASAPKEPQPLSAKERVDKVIQVCALLHSQHSQNPKYTDCSLRGNELKLSFADQSTYRGESTPVAQMVQAFCFAGQSSQQKTLTLYYSWQFRKEGRTTRRKCPEVEFVRPAPDFSEPK